MMICNNVMPKNGNDESITILFNAIYSPADVVKALLYNLDLINRNLSFVIICIY